MAEQNIVREADNQVVIEGTLMEIRHQEWKSKNGINIELDVEVAENEVHTVKGMSSYTKKNGSENGIAKGYKTVVEEYKSVASHGREEADKVRITQGRVGVNEYYGQDGILRSFPELSSNFFNRLSAGDTFNPRAEFEVEIFVKSVVPEIKNDDETGRAKVNAIIPMYGGKVIPFEFVVGEDGAGFVEDNYTPGTTAKVFGNIVNFKEVKETEVEVAFGKPQKKISTKTIREYLITGGHDPYEEDDAKAYSVETIQKAMVERETYLAELKNGNNQPKTEEKKGGFGSKGSEQKDTKKNPPLPF